MINSKKTKKAVVLLLLISTMLSAFAISGTAYGGVEDKDVTCFSNVSNSTYAKDAEVKMASRFKELFFGNKSSGELMLCPGGCAFGVKINGSGVRVARACDSRSDCPLKTDDKILKINGTEVYSTEEVREVLNKSASAIARLDIERDGKKLTVIATPSRIGEEYRLGVLLSDSSSGIGTITYINPETQDFGGLGHGISGSDGGELLKMSSGEVTGVILGGANRGEAGKPGELKGVLCGSALGSIEKNTECGVFGKLNDDGIAKKCTEKPIPVASKKEVSLGEATIISTIKGSDAKRYKIEITDIDYSSLGSKSFKIKVTDDTLIALTGGIVRGMSGSPIIQNGKLIGAVTHVMVANATEGYGIFIENMLSAAEGQAVPKAA